MNEMPVVKLPLYGRNGKGKFVLVDGDYDGEYFGQFKWYLNKGGYAMRYDWHRYQETGVQSYLYLHQEVSRTPKGLVTDHINRDRLDNRSCNLRWVTWSGNAKNRKHNLSNKRNAKGRFVSKNLLNT